jgi:uncharacterized protein (TIGR03435 family)
MRPDLQNIDEVVKRYWPPASNEEMKSDVDRVRRQLESGTARSINPVLAQPFRWRIAMVAAASILLLSVVGIFVWPHSESFAVVESEEGSLFRVVDGQPAPIQAREQLQSGEMVRTNSAAGAQLLLADGSRVEMRSTSELVLEHADDGVRIRLNTGGVIVNATKQHNRHLYVQTKDVVVSVVGTVFLVNTETEGSRVAVIEGEVRVRQGETEQRLLPGDQVTTNPSTLSLAVKEEIAWSRSAKEHLELLQQSAVTGDQNKFEALVVRPESGNGGLRGAPVRCNGIDGVFPLPPRGVAAGTIGDVSAVPRGRCVGRYVTLITLITTAYGVPERNVSGGPDWMRSSLETFQIHAKAEASSTVTKDQLREMLKKLLIDQFKLKIRRDTKEAPGHALVVSQNGPQLRPASGDADLYLEQNGRRNQFNMLRGGQITIKGQATLQVFADYLSVAPLLALNHVVDKTGLPGMYEFSLTLNMVPPELPGRGGVRGEGTALSSPRIDWDPSIAKAMEDQLGLSLVSQRVPEAVLVIEHAEKPSEN